MTTAKEKTGYPNTHDLLLKGRQERSNAFFLALQSILKERDKTTTANDHQLSQPTSV